MKYDFTKIETSALDGTPVMDLHKTIANSVYLHTKDLGLVTIAQDIYAGKEVEITQPQLEEIKRIISDEQIGFFAFVKKAIIDFINQ